MIGSEIGSIQRGKATGEAQEVSAAGTARSGEQGVLVGLQEAGGALVQGHADRPVQDNLGSTLDDGRE